VTASRKLFIVAVLLAAGFGVARLMGSPAVRLYTPSSRDQAAETRIAAANRNSQASSTAAAPASSTRLVPDFGADNPYRAESDSASATGSQSRLPGNDQRNETYQLQARSTSANHESSPYAVYTPRARLRDEAPRPMDFSDRPPPVESVAVPAQYPRTDAALATASAISVEPIAPRGGPENWQASLTAPGTSNAAPESPPAIAASYSQPVEPALNQVLITAPPWPAPSLLLDDDSGPRKHIVTDGDSLEKLAGRYLDDPQRGNEIFEANREMLSSPDLLPIGAELVIPDRANPAGPDFLKGQSSAAGGATIRAALHNMVPIRPIPAAASVMPRAQLLPPRPVE
jgi:nucleoid-associated protein YgaU